MTRRFWPAALTAVSILLLASYLAYTQYIVRQIRQEADVHRDIIALVQQGMLLLGTEGAADNIIIDLQARLGGLNVPIVFFNAVGEPAQARNLPFAYDLSTPEGRAEVHMYAARLAATKPQNVVPQPGIGIFYFGDPPILGWLRWIPLLQVGAGVLLMAIAFIVMRADIRAHREQLWSAMARELAHQMGTPLSSLSGWVEVLQLTADERDALASPDRIGRLMQSDVERLERVSRRFELVGKRQPLQRVEVAQVVHELVDYFGPRLPHLGRGITLRARIDPTLDAVQANPVLLVWALENIVKNAIDALAGRGGRISIIATTRPQPRRSSARRPRAHSYCGQRARHCAVGARPHLRTGSIDEVERLGCRPVSQSPHRRGAAPGADHRGDARGGRGRLRRDAAGRQDVGLWKRIISTV
jgi:signal transduction histidine kinase